MSDIASSLLTYPFRSGVLDWPKDVLILGADYFSDVSELENYDVVQSFKPFAYNFKKKNIYSVPEIKTEKIYSAVLCVLSKQKDFALYQLAMASNILEKNGMLLACAENDSGGKRLEKWFKDLGFQPQSISKSKCRMTWAHKENLNQNKIEEYIENGSHKGIQLKDKTYITRPGVYGWNKIDVGSAMLVELLPNNLSGVGADFGCGYGFLSDIILSKNKDIKKLYSIDADFNALECCKQNLKKYEDRVMIDYGWEDLNQKPNDIKNLDWIVMNPPFHEGKNTDIAVGQNFIQTAALSLRKGGTLYMVANAHLPYEGILEEKFSEIKKIEEKQGFKVYQAIL